MTHNYGILAHFSQSTRSLHVESFIPELLFLLDHFNNSSHPAPHIRRLVTFTPGNIHNVRMELTSNPLPFKTISHVSIIKFYLQYVHSLVTIQHINIYIGFIVTLVLATAWPLTYINCISFHVITILVCDWIQLWYTGLILGMPLFNKVAHCVTAWPNVPCLDKITTYWTMVLPPLSDIDCSVIWPDLPWHMVIYHVLNCPHWLYTTCGMELMCGDRVAGSKLTWT